MKYLKVMHGQPIASIKGLAAQFGVSDRTIRTVLREMEEENERWTVCHSGRRDIETGKFHCLCGLLEQPEIIAVTERKETRPAI